MADAVSTKTIFNGSRKLIMQFTNLSDGTGESAVTKVDKSTYTGPNGLEPTSLVVEKIEGHCDGMEVRVYCDRTSALTIANIGSGGKVCLHYAEDGFQTNTAGATGDILFTTTGHSSGDSYNLIIHMRKKD